MLMLGVGVGVGVEGCGCAHGRGGGGEGAGCVQGVDTKGSCGEGAPTSRQLRGHHTRAFTHSSLLYTPCHPHYQITPSIVSTLTTTQQELKLKEQMEQLYAQGKVDEAHAKAAAAAAADGGGDAAAAADGEAEGNGVGDDAKIADDEDAGGCGAGSGGGGCSAADGAGGGVCASLAVMQVALVSRLPPLLRLLLLLLCAVVPTQLIVSP